MSWYTKPLKYSWKHEINISLNTSTTGCKWQSERLGYTSLNWSWGISWMEQSSHVSSTGQGQLQPSGLTVFGSYVFKGKIRQNPFQNTCFLKIWNLLLAYTSVNLKSKLSWRHRRYVSQILISPHFRNWMFPSNWITCYCQWLAETLALIKVWFWQLSLYSLLIVILFNGCLTFYSLFTLGAE